MYNEELKLKFIRETTSSESGIRYIVNLFSLTEKFEEEWQADICTRTKNEIEMVIGEILSTFTRTQYSMMSRLRTYGKWCMANDVPDAKDGLLRVELDDVGSEKIKKSTICSPDQLVKYLENVFVSETDDTLDNIYKCYLWLAYSGVKEETAITLKTSDVDLDLMYVKCDGSQFSIYEDGFSAIANCVNLTEFRYFHNNPEYSCMRERLDNNLLLRGIKANSNPNILNNVVLRKSQEARREGRVDKVLNYRKVYVSGFFYRAYELEHSGVSIDFILDMDNMLNGYERPQYRKNAIQKLYLNDYIKWKEAFDLG